jgi:hypothetical protein
MHSNINGFYLGLGPKWWCTDMFFLTFFYLFLIVFSIYCDLCEYCTVVFVFVSIHFMFI